VNIKPVAQRATGTVRSALSQTRSGSPNRKEAVFGSFDGMTSTLGVVAGLLAANATPPKILAGAIGIAVAATIGMGAGQYLSDGKRNMRKAVVMAVATLIGSVLPALPFIFGTSLACVLSSVLITIGAAGVIGYYRGYVFTFSILLIVSILTVGLSISVA
jgi:VIT1/CCC1 family predicted Fe2+/Mn2+ transporter